MNKIKKYRSIHVYLKPATHINLLNEIKSFKNEFSIKLTVTDVSRDAITAFLNSHQTKEEREKYLKEKGFLEQ